MDTANYEQRRCEYCGDTHADEPDHATACRRRHDLAIAHGEREGMDDYNNRAADVASGAEPADWAWPLAGADEAYFNAVSTCQICREIGISTEDWESVSDAWFAAFRSGYVRAHEGSE
jgi:hypothetical protein